MYLPAAFKRAARLKVGSAHCSNGVVGVGRVQVAMDLIPIPGDDRMRLVGDWPALQGSVGATGQRDFMLCAKCSSHFMVSLPGSHDFQQGLSETRADVPFPLRAVQLTLKKLELFLPLTSILYRAESGFRRVTVHVSATGVLLCSLSYPHLVVVGLEIESL